MSAVQPTIRRQLITDNMSESLVHAYECYKWNGNTVDHFLSLENARTMQIMRDNGTGTPTFLYCGPDSIAARFFGQEFARNCAGQPGVPDREFGQSLCGTYNEVSWTQNPELDRIVATTCGWWVDFERLVLPATLGDGSPVFTVCLTPLRVFQDLHSTANADPQVHSRLRTVSLGSRASRPTHGHSAEILNIQDAGHSRSEPAPQS